MRVIFLSCLLSVILIRCAAQEKTPTPQWRPVYHFTPEKTWTNDPNGLFYFDGFFHLYFQNNPFDNVWGHMSWGHAVSKDLVHWQHLPVAIPEVVKKDSVISIFSGSAVVDSHNSSGFSKNGESPLVAIFTGDLPKQKKEAQYIAYSNDTGKTFSFYTGNPVIDLNRADFRDPNVFWYEPAKEWVMTVSLVHEHKIRLYGSKDLKAWTILSDFGPAGYTGHDWECPFLVPLPVNGNSSKIKWVLFVSCWGDKAPYIQYFTGDFDGKNFHNDNSNKQILTVDNGDCFYAAIPWRLEHNQQILIGWLVPGNTATNPWRGQMSIPRDLSLRNTNEGLRLFQQPASIIRKTLSALSAGRNNTWKHIRINNKILMPTGIEKYTGNAYWAEATFDVKKTSKAGINIAEDTTNNHKIAVGYDVNKQLLYIDFGVAGKRYKSVENILQTAPLKSINGKVKIQILLDKSSLEVFGNDGEKVISAMLYPTANETGISLFSEGKATVERLSLWDLNRTGEK
ncbi:glycoside hydrolase [Arachidicoccus ginsenosidimutans]|uniref:glycoside hydrolase family 32 protein n=1 Tax=Arachidicoccus sp. BS20 TaxID=1850526 RepID=UPI0007F07FA0|nr:glycoside hydrolase family 32 protein [Arachidicoccus sp. BS20]ANI88448.1 glycoside hydrolase [Arachidicoccus sp. BS20]